MKILVIGKGGREHAIVRALQQSPSAPEVHVAPGSAAMTDTVRHNLSLKDHGAVVSLCKGQAFDLVIIGPEDPLVDGLADSLRAEDISVFGPDKNGAQLEGSKIAAKVFMEKYSVPTSAFHTVSSVSQLKDCYQSFKPPYVLKADGLAGGKGVFICKTEVELFAAAESILKKNL